MSEQLKVLEIDLEDVFEDMVRVHLDHRPNIKAGQLAVVCVGKKTKRAVVRGSKANQRGVISMDLATRERLGLSAGATADFRFKKANLLDDWIWMWNATNASARAAARLGLISLILGFIGLVLGAVPLLR